MVGSFTRHVLALYTVGSAIVLLVLQLVLVYGASFRSGWDVGWLTEPDAETVVEYLFPYPNNLFLYGVFRIVARLGVLIGVSDPYVAQVLGGCLCV